MNEQSGGDEGGRCASVDIISLQSQICATPRIPDNQPKVPLEEAFLLLILSVSFFPYRAPVIIDCLPLAISIFLYRVFVYFAHLTLVTGLPNLVVCWLDSLS